jgi:hypothetical protein
MDETRVSVTRLLDDDELGELAPICGEPGFPQPSD